MGIMMIVRYYDNSGFVANVCMNIVHVFTLFGLCFCIGTLYRKISVIEYEAWIAALVLHNGLFNSH